MWESYYQGKKYWDIPEDIKIEEMEVAEFQDKDEGNIQDAYHKDEEYQPLRTSWKKELRKLRG